MTKRLLLGFFLFCFVLVVLIALLPGSKTPSVSLPFAPTPTPLYYTSQRAQLPPQLSPLEKFQLGQVAQDAIQKNGGIVATTSADNEVVYSIPSVNALIPDTLVVKNNTIIYERTSTATSTSGGMPSLLAYLKQYGTPEQTIEDTNAYAPTATAYLYPTKGVVFVGNPLTDETFEIQRFVPMTLIEYLRLYGDTVAAVKEQEQITSE